MTTRPPSTSSKSGQHPTSLPRRILFPSLAATDALPPLLASPSANPALNFELYDFIALALRAYVNPWWTKITRYDKQFIPDVTRILTVVMRAVEARVLAADLAALVFHDLPTLLTQHYRDYRNAASKMSTSYASGTALSLPQLFHQLQPHIAVSVDGKIEPEYFRVIVDHILKLSLPPEDYEPEVERLIVREVILKILLQDVIPKITQPWFIQSTILDLLDPSSNDTHSFNPPDALPLATHAPAHSGFSFHVILIVILSAIQSISSIGLAVIHAYKQALGTIKLVKSRPPPHTPPPQTKRRMSAQISPINTHLDTPVSLPPHHLEQWPAVQTQDFASPVLVMLAEIFTTCTRFCSSLLMSTLKMCCAAFTPFLDRLLIHLLAQAVSPALLTTLTATAKHTLFPHGYPLPPPPDPLPEEQAAIREKLISFRPKGALGAYAMPFLLGSNGGDTSSRTTLHAALEPLTCAECNVHLIVLIVDKLVLWLWPELGFSGQPPHADTGTGQVGEEKWTVPPPEQGSRETSVTPPGSFRQEWR